MLPGGLRTTVTLKHCGHRSKVPRIEVSYLEKLCLFIIGLYFKKLSSRERANSIWHSSDSHGRSTLQIHMVVALFRFTRSQRSSESHGRDTLQIHMVAALSRFTWSQRSVDSHGCSAL